MQHNPYLEVWPGLGGEGRKIPVAGHEQLDIKMIRLQSEECKMSEEHCPRARINFDFDVTGGLDGLHRAAGALLGW